MGALHITQGDTDRDKRWLERAAKENLDSSRWTIPKSAEPGDDVVIYVAGYGFFATAIIKSVPKPRPDWLNRYGAGLTSIKLIQPAISIGAIRKKIPRLTWAKYPRSVTTPDAETAEQIRRLISLRRKTRMPDLDEDALSEANIDELRKVALLRARPSATTREQKVISRARSFAVKRYVLLRSKGFCEGCNEPAPFKTPNGSPYLEPHHTLRLADDGPDHPAHVIALCPNCHRKAHYAVNAEAFKAHLIKTLSVLEAG